MIRREVCEIGNIIVDVIRESMNEKIKNVGNSVGM